MPGLSPGVASVCGLLVSEPLQLRTGSRPQGSGQCSSMQAQLRGSQALQCRLISCAQSQLLLSRWNPPRPGTEPVSPALVPCKAKWIPIHWATREVQELDVRVLLRPPVCEFCYLHLFFHTLNNVYCRLYVLVLFDYFCFLNNFNMMFAQFAGFFKKLIK